MFFIMRDDWTGWRLPPTGYLPFLGPELYLDHDQIPNAPEDQIGLCALSVCGSVIRLDGRQTSIDIRVEWPLIGQALPVIQPKLILDGKKMLRPSGDQSFGLN